MPIFSSTTAKTLSNVDAAWLSMEDPTNLMMVTGVMMFEQPIDFERLKTVVERRLLRFDRFSMRVVQAKGRFSKPYWEPDPTFDISAHIHRLALPSPGDETALQDLVSDLMSAPVDYNRPLWHLYLIENYGEGCVLLAKLHHAIADGIALAYILLSLTDDTPDAPEPPPPTPAAKKRRSRLASLVNTAFSLAKTTTKLTGKLVDESLDVLADRSRLTDLAQLSADGAASAGRLFLRLPDPQTLYKGKLGVSKRAAWSKPVPLKNVKAIGKVMGGTVNDVLLTAMTGALRQYMEERGEETTGVNFRAVVPVNLRPTEDEPKLGNQFGLVFLSLPVGIADPVDRLYELKQRMDTLKGSTEAVVAFGILNAIGLSSNEIRKIIIDMLQAKATAVMTNVPGPREQRYLAGIPMRSVMFWVPQSGRLGLGISILSYAGEVRLGVATDAQLVPNPERICDMFHAEFDEMMKLVALAQADVLAHATPAAPAKVRCTATTKSGKPCKNKAASGSTFCYLHQPQ